MADVEGRQFDEWQLLNWNKEGVAVNLWFRILYHVQRDPTLTATSWQNQGNELLTLEALEAARSWTSAHRKNDLILYTLSQLTWTIPEYRANSSLRRKNTHAPSFPWLISILYQRHTFGSFFSYYNLCFPSFLWQSEIWRIRKKRKKDYLNLSLKQRVLVWLFEKRQEFVNSVGEKSTKFVPDFLFVLSFFVYVYDNRFCIWVCKISGLGRRIFVLFSLAD